MNTSQLIDLDRLENQALRFALDQVDEAMLILKPEPLMSPGPRICMANRKAAEMTGLPVNELAGAPIARIVDSGWAEELLRKLPVVAQMRRKFQTEKRLLCADGTSRLCRWTVTGMVDGSGRPLRYLLAFQDAGAATPASGAAGTPRGRRLPDSIDLLLERSRMESLAMLTVGVAHDFNNVLTSVGLHLAMAKLASGAGDEVRNELDQAESAVKGGQAMAKQLLSFAKGNAPKRCAGNLGEILRQAEQLAMIGAKVRCDLSIATSLWSCRVEETQILQVFHNLLMNARQAMPNGGSIQVSCENLEVGENSSLPVKPGPYVVTAVRDYGCGIPQEQLARIFEPYFTTKESGTGIGLFTCQIAVRRHDGLITVRSKVGVGTEFRVYLPAAREPAPQTSSPLPGASEPSGRVARTGAVATREGSILVVEDEPDVRMLAVKLLRSLGYEATGVLNGEEALRIYVERLNSGRPFDAVLMDMNLPGGMSGEDAFRELLSVDPQVRAIATSGFFEVEEQELQARGYLGKLAKPYSRDDLEQTLGSIFPS